MKTIITGCHGLLGQKCIEVFGASMGTLYGVDLQEKSLFPGLLGYHYKQLDLTDRDAVIKFVESVNPDYIIHTAAMTNVDACEIEQRSCWKINVDAVGYLAEAASRCEAKLVHLSSDYVFDGSAGPYTELDRPNPISQYGKSKLASEQVVFGASNNNAVIRTTVVFGHGRSLRPNFVAWLVKNLREGNEVKIVTDQISNVTLVDDLAKAIKRILQLKKSGLYNVAGRQIISRYEFTLEIAEAYGLDDSKIKTTLTRLLGQNAPRPLQAGLIVDKAQKELDLVFCNVEEALKAYREHEARLN